MDNYLAPVRTRSLPDLLATQPANGICPGNRGVVPPESAGTSPGTAPPSGVLAQFIDESCAQPASGHENTGVRPVSSGFAVIVSPACGHLPPGGWPVLCWRPACRDAGGPSGVDGFEVIRLTHRCPEGPVTRSGREIMEIFEAFDLTGTAWSAAQLAGCDAKTVARYVAIREAGGDPLARAARPRLIDGSGRRSRSWSTGARARSGRTWRTGSSPRWATRGRSALPDGRSRR